MRSGSHERTATGIVDMVTKHDSLGAPVLCLLQVPVARIPEPPGRCTSVSGSTDKLWK